MRVSIYIIQATVSAHMHAGPTTVRRRYAVVATSIEQAVKTVSQRLPADEVLGVMVTLAGGLPKIECLGDRGDIVDVTPPEEPTR